MGNDAVTLPTVGLVPPPEMVIPPVIPPMILLVIPLVNPLSVDDRWLYHRFRDCNPPTFKGSLDPKVAEAWLEEFEKIFDVMECLKEEKNHLAIFTL